MAWSFMICFKSDWNLAISTILIHKTGMLGDPVILWLINSRFCSPVNVLTTAELPDRTCFVKINIDYCSPPIALTVILPAWTVFVHTILEESGHSFKCNCVTLSPCLL